MICYHLCQLTGALPLACTNLDEMYVPRIHACLPQQLIASDAVRFELLSSRTCNGGVFTTATSLQRLRFCNQVFGSVVLANITERIDVTVFWDIQSIEGALYSECGSAWSLY